MIVAPVVVCVVWIAVARARDGGAAPLTPTTAVGTAALASVALIVLVALTDASLAATVPTGVVLLGLASFARWARRDTGLLLVVPFAFGLSTLILPLLFE